VTDTTIILSISEEYGYRNWYAILSERQFEQLKEDWQTLKGLNCLVPVQFLVPQAKPLWALPFTQEHQVYLTQDGLAQHNVRIRSAHIHEPDDSGLADLKYSIPEQRTFEFLGTEYTEDEVTKLMHEYSDRESREFERTRAAHPEIATMPVMYPEAWQAYSSNLPIFEVTEIIAWPDDEPLPDGFERDEDGNIFKTDK
jgi:hypothetical protein